MIRHVGALLFPLVLSATAFAQVDQKRIDDAIAKGIAYLKTSESSGWDQHINNCDELILLTYIHADVPETDARSEVFGDIRPVATMVEVSALISPELLVEIEVDAYVASD